MAPNAQVAAVGEQHATDLGLDLDARISAAMAEHRWEDAEGFCAGLETSIACTG